MPTFSRRKFTKNFLECFDSESANREKNTSGKYPERVPKYFRKRRHLTYERFVNLGFINGSKHAWFNQVKCKVFSNNLGILFLFIYIKKKHKTNYILIHLQEIWRIEIQEDVFLSNILEEYS